MLKKTLIIVFFICVFLPSFGQQVYHNEKLENSKKYLKGNLYQRDALLLFDLVKDTHPAVQYDGYNKIVNIERKRVYRRLGHCNNDIVFRKTIQSFLSVFEDGHTTLKYEPDQSLIYPISFEQIEDGVVVDKIQRGYESCLGKTISSINGNDFWEQYYDIIDSLFSYDNVYYKNSKVNVILPYYSNWVNAGGCKLNSLLNIAFTDGSNIQLEPIRQSQIDLVQNLDKDNLLTSVEKSLFSYTIIDSLKLCYFIFNSCADRKTYALDYARQGLLSPEILSKLEDIPSFDEYVEGMFDTILEKGVETLVIDVRNNSGGNSNLGDVLLSWLMPYDDIMFYSSLVSDSVLLKDRHRISNLLTLPSNPKGIEFEERININADRCFTGNVIVFQSEKTYSSAGMFVTMIRDNKRGIIAGTMSSYRPDGYGDILLWTLPNTGLSGSISYKKFCRPDQSHSVETSLAPDYILYKKDSFSTPYKDFLLSYLKSKM